MNRHTRWRHLSQHSKDRVILGLCFCGLVFWALGSRL